MRRFGLDLRRVPSIGIEKATTDLKSPSVTLSEGVRNMNLIGCIRVADRTGLSIYQIVWMPSETPTEVWFYTDTLSKAFCLIYHIVIVYYLRRRVMLAKGWKESHKTDSRAQPHLRTGLVTTPLCDLTFLPGTVRHLTTQHLSTFLTNRLSFDTLYSKEASWKTAPSTFSFRLSELSGRACIIGAKHT